MRLRHNFTLDLVPKSGPIVSRRFHVTRSRCALRAVRKQLVGIEQIHVYKDGERIRSIDLGDGRS